MGAFKKNQRWREKKKRKKKKKKKKKKKGEKQCKKFLNYVNKNSCLRWPV